jgi:hypothetical protein
MKVLVTGGTGLKRKGYAPELLRLIEDQPKSLASWRGRTPALCISRNESRLSRIILVFRRDLDCGGMFEI